MATLENRENFFLYALEDTSCMNRFICGGNRPWTMNVTQGAQAGGPLVRGVSAFSGQARSHTAQRGAKIGMLCKGKIRAGRLGVDSCVLDKG